MYTPCFECKIHYNKEYNPDCDIDCDFAVKVLRLKEVKSVLERISFEKDAKAADQAVKDLLQLLDDIPDLK